MGCHFFSRAILQQAGNATNKSLVKFSKHVFFTILSFIIDVHVAKKRFHITLDLALSNLDFRVKRKNSAGDVEIAVGAEEIIHRAHIGVFDAQELN